MTDSRLFRLAFQDEVAERYENYWALSIGFGYAVLNIFVFARPERQVLIETAVVACLTILVYSIWYCNRRVDVAADQEFSSTRALVLRYAAGAALFLADYQVSKVQAAVLDERLRKLSSGPLTPAKLEEMRETLNVAKEQKVVARRETIDNIATTLTQEAKNNSQAWEAIAELASYRSSVELSESLLPTAHLPRAEAAEYTFYHDPQIPGGIRSYGAAPIDQAAVFERLTDQLNKNLKIAPAFVEVAGGALAVDGMRMRHVTFRGALITFFCREGFQMEDVYFLNCGFRVKRCPAGMRFLETTAMSPHIERLEVDCKINAAECQTPPSEQ